MKPAISSLLTLFILYAAAGPASAQTYDLRGSSPRQGTIIQTRTEIQAPDGVLNVETGGTSNRGKLAKEAVTISEMEIIQTIGKELTMFRYQVAEDWFKSSVQFGDAAPETTIEDDPFVGETLLIERQSDGWRKTMLGHEPDERQKARLRDPYFDDTEIYPATPVALGDSWTVEGLQLAMFQGFANALSADGKATFTLQKVSDEAGDRRAIIPYRLELRVRFLNEAQVPVDLSLGGSGTLQRSLNTYLDVSNRFSGQVHLTASVTENGQKANLTEAGAMEITSVQRLVTPETRAAVVRRAPAAPARQVSAPPPTATKNRNNEAPLLLGTPEKTCTGLARSCAQRGEFDCTLGSGCSATGLCSGTPIGSCFGKPQFSCGLTPGCWWNSWTNSCGGFLSCAGANRFSCGSTPGCRWQSSCLGIATPCASLPQWQCNLQPGCSFK